MITSVTEMLNGTPEVINSDPYGDGWMFEIEVSDLSELDDALDADAYAELVEE